MSSARYCRPHRQPPESLPSGVAVNPAQSTAMSIPSPVRKSLEKLHRRSAPWLIGSATKPDGSCGCYVLDRDGDARAVADLPTAADGVAWGKLLVAAMQRPLPMHEPGLPRRLVCDDGKTAALIAPIVSPLSIAVELAASPHLAAAAAGVAGKSGPCLEALPDAPRSFYAAAARLAALEPWDWFDEQPEFAIASADSNAPPAVAVLMGGLGSSFGFALFRSAAELQEDLDMPRPRVRRVPHTVLELDRATRAPAALRTRSAERGYAVCAADRYPLALRVGEDGPIGWDATAIPGLSLAASAILRWCQLAKEGQPFAKEAGAAVLMNRHSFAGIDHDRLGGDDADRSNEEDLVLPCDPIWELPAPDQPPILRLPVQRDALDALNDALSQSQEIEVDWGPQDAYGILNFAEDEEDGEEGDDGDNEDDGEAVGAVIGVEFTTLPDAAWLRAAALAGDAALVVLVDGDVSAESASSGAEGEAAPMHVEFYGLNALRKRLDLPEVNYGSGEAAVADAAWSTDGDVAEVQFNVTTGDVAAMMEALQGLDRLDLLCKVHDCPSCGFALLSFGSFDAAGYLDARVIVADQRLPDSAWLDLARAQGVRVEVALDSADGAGQEFAWLDLPLGAVVEVKIP